MTQATSAPVLTLTRRNTRTEATSSLPRTSDPAGPYVLSRADIAECTCPEYCDRDHANE